MNKYLKKIKKAREKGIRESLALAGFHLKTNAYFKSKAFLKSLKIKPSEKKTILFYPQKPSSRNVIWKLCHLNAFKITSNPNEKFDIAFNWEDATFRKKDKILKKLSKNHNVFNIKCKDISKKKTGKTFKKVFKYPIIVNPKKINGKCVKKSNLNAQKDGQMIQCPAKKEKGYVYEVLVNTEIQKGKLVDMRVPIMKDKIPFVYFRYKSLKDRFKDSKKPKASIIETKKVFSKQEISQILKFCKKLGLDYGELDILRDKKSKKIYIVDVNTTPFGPHRLSRKVTKEALEKLSQAFLTSL